MRGFKIARIFGIDIELDKSLIVVFLLVLWSISAKVLPSQVQGQPSLYYWLFGALATILFFVSLLFHELSHSLVAKRFGISVKTIMLFILGGIAFLEENPKSAKVEFLMAGAGPLSSLVLAGFFWFSSVLGRTLFAPLLIACLNYLAFINVLLAVFNLLPGFPLDGGRVFKAILWGFSKNEAMATIIAAFTGKIIGILLMMAGGAFVVFLGDPMGGLWLIFIGLFLFGAANNAIRQIKMKK